MSYKNLLYHGERFTDGEKLLAAKIYISFVTTKHAQRAATSGSIISPLADEIAECSVVFIKDVVRYIPTIVPYLLGKVPLRCLVHGARQGWMTTDGVFTAKYKDHDRLEDLSKRCLYSHFVRYPYGAVDSKTMLRQIKRCDVPLVIWYSL